jgi:hypothetical protein
MTAATDAHREVGSGAGIACGDGRAATGNVSRRGGRIARQESVTLTPTTRRPHDDHATTRSTRCPRRDARLAVTDATRLRRL